METIEEKKERAIERAREHYYKYREAHLKARKKWKEANPDKVKEYERKRYEKRKHLKEENEQLHSIIKEVREYIMTKLITEWDIKNDGYVSGSDLPVDAITPILEILDKVSDE